MRLLSVCLAVLTITAITGFGVMFYYVPAPGYVAGAGVEHPAVSFGGILRGIHFWTAQIVGLVILVHLLVSLVRQKQGDRKPKAVWAAGWMLLLLTIALWLSGIILPWDTLSFWLKDLASERGIHLTLLQIYWTHAALLPIITGLIVIYYVRGIRKTLVLTGSSEIRI